MKEMSLRAKDGSKTSVDAYKALGLNAAKMTKEFNTGGETAKKAFETVVKALQKTDDETIRNTVSTGLFGTQYEDLGEKAFDSMLKASEGLDNVEGATKKASDAIRDNLGTRATKVFRDFQEDLVPIGEDLLDIAEDILPKVADTVGKVTDAFGDMSPEARETALMIGGIAAAAGPVLIGLGGLATGVGTLTKIAAPLVTTLGVGKGLTGVLSKIPGPVGLAVTAISLGTIAFNAINDATEKAREVNLDHVKSLIDQQQSLEGLSGKYDMLRDKNKLSNDELLRFRDIQSELKTAKSAEEITKLKDEAIKLTKESGLSNIELEEMLKLNDQIIDKTPEVSQSYSDRGNAVIESKDAIDEVNAALSRSIALELENQKIKNDANLDGNIRNYIVAQEELTAKIRERQAAEQEAESVTKEITDLKALAQQQHNDGQVAAAQMTEDEITRMQFVLDQQNQKISGISSEVTEKQKSVEKTGEEITKTQALYGEMINLQLAQVGINEKGSEGIAQLDQAINKTKGRIQELLLARDAQGGLNAKQQEELDNLDSALVKYNGAKGEIIDMQGEQEGVNQKIREGTGEAEKLTKEAGKDVDKDVNVDDHGGAKKVSDEAGKNAKKNVNVDDNGDNKKIQNNAEKKANKKVQLSLLNTLSSLLPSAISVGVNLIGKLSGVGNNAKGTKNWRGGLTWVGEEGPELMHLPQGAKVIPNPESEKILRNWNIPMMATGGVTLTDGMALVGEEGRELVDLSGAKTLPLNSYPGRQVNDLSPLVSAINNLASRSIDISINSREIIHATADGMQNKIDFNTKRKSLFSGG